MFDFVDRLVRINGGSISENELPLVPSILFDTLLSGISGGLGALIVYRLRYKHIDPISIMIGSLAGLVAVTAGVNFLNPLQAFMVGFISGGLAIVGVWLLEKSKIDDVVSAVPVHLIGGVWGTLALALFGDKSLFPNGNSRLEQLSIQALGIGACALFTITIIYLSFKTFNLFAPMRVTEQEEDEGLNIVEHHASTELYDFYRILNKKDDEDDITVVHTEIGQLAKSYKDRLERDLREKTQSLRDFLKLTQQGFLTFGDNFLIDIGYSDQCKKIFNIEALEGMNFADLLYQEKPRQKQEFINSLELFFHHNKESMIIFKLLDNSLIWEDSHHNQKEIRLQYKETSDKKILCIITDVTTIKELEQQAEASTDYQKKLLKVITNNRFFSQFFDNIRDLLLLYQKSIKDLQVLEKSQNISNLYLLTHDLKAQMGFFGFDDSLIKLHDMETLLLNALEENSPIDKKLFKKSAASIEKTFNTELNFFKNSLGDEWFENFESLNVSPESITELLNLVKDAYPQDKKLFQKISLLKIKPFIKSIPSLKNLVIDLAYKLDKKIKPFHINIEKNLIVPNEIAKPLIACFSTYHTEHDRSWYRSS